MSKSKLFVSAALVLTGALGAGMAHARDVDVHWSVTIGAPFFYGQPMPVYSMPAPVYSRPPPVWIQPVPVVPRGAYWQPTGWDRDGDGVPNRYDARYNPRWDRDGDGIPNRYDANYNPRGDRDGDGIPNQRDPYDNRRHDRDGDGIPNRYDRNDSRAWNGR